MRVLLLAAALASLSLAPALASPPAKTDPALAPWFQSLRNPALGISCCAEAGGHILGDADWCVVGNTYQLRISGEWQDVPAGAVLDRVDNPTGGAVAFYPPGVDHPPVYCFIRPVET